MIALCTGAPAFEFDGEQTIVSFPSGRGDAVRVALSRHQLCYLSQTSQAAMVEAFKQPQATEASHPIALHRDGEAA
ncbi:MAG: hypothetical protein ACK4MR_03160 [Erythrobacter cryptus]